MVVAVDRHPGIGAPCRRHAPDLQRRLRGKARRVVGRLEAEDRDQPCATRFLHLATEAAHRLGDLGKGGRRFEVRRRTQPHVQERQMAAFPLLRVASRPGRRPAPARCTVRDRRDGADETVAAARQRLDPAVAVRGLGQGPSDGRDLGGEIAFLDDHAGPGEIEDVLFCHELVRACDQHVEHGHATTTQGRRRVAIAEHAGRGIEPERPDPVHGGQADVSSALRGSPTRRQSRSAAAGRAGAAGCAVLRSVVSMFE